MFFKICVPYFIFKEERKCIHFRFLENVFLFLSNFQGERKIFHNPKKYLFLFFIFSFQRERVLTKIIEKKNFFFNSDNFLFYSFKTLKNCFLYFSYLLDRVKSAHLGTQTQLQQNCFKNKLKLYFYTKSISTYSQLYKYCSILKNYNIYMIENE